MPKLADGSALTGRIETVKVSAERLTLAVNETLRQMRTCIGSTHCELVEGDIQAVEAIMLNKDRAVLIALADLRDLRVALRARTDPNALIPVMEDAAMESTSFGNAVSLLVGCIAGEGYVTLAELETAELISTNPAYCPDAAGLLDWFEARLSRLWAVLNRLRRATAVEANRTRMATALGRYTA